MSRHQARLRAAAAAASMYEKSYVYPSATSVAWYAKISVSFHERFALHLVLHTRVHS